MTVSQLYPVAAMVAFARDALANCGVPEAEAAIAAKAMIEVFRAAATRIDGLG